MFFSKINCWSYKRLQFLWLLFNLLYLFTTLVAPIAIICIKYNVFKSNTDKTISGFSMIILLIFFILILRSFKKVVDKLHDLTYKQQLLKYTMQMLYSLIFPVAAIVMLLCFKNDFMLAYDTFKWVLIFIILGIIIDHLFIKFLDKERELRYAAKEKLEIESRLKKGVI